MAKLLGKQHGSGKNGSESMAGKVKLDTVDRQILSDLQEDGRMTNVDLAKRAGISAPPCLLHYVEDCRPTFSSGRG